jgi:hypothetical protein
LFKGLDRTKVDKINELIDALNEKDRLLEKQEDILYEEHDKFISVQKSLALEIKRNKMLSSEMSTGHDSISTLKNLNDELNAKLEGVNATSACVEHVVICNRCKDIDLDEHATTIVKLNNEVASLNAQLKTCKDDYDKLKFARDAYTVGRHPSIKDGLGFQKETKNLTSQWTSSLNREKGKAPMASSSSHDQKNHAYLYTHVKKVSHHDRSYDHVVLPVYHNSHAMVASSSTYAYGRNRPRCNHAMSHAPRKVCNGPTTVYHAYNTSFMLSCKNAKVVA